MRSSNWLLSVLKMAPSNACARVAMRNAGGAGGSSGAVSRLGAGNGRCNVPVSFVPASGRPASAKLKPLCNSHYRAAGSRRRIVSVTILQWWRAGADCDVCIVVPVVAVTAAAAFGGAVVIGLSSWSFVSAARGAPTQG